jgi:cyanophycinase
MKATKPWRPVYSPKKGAAERSAQETAQRTFLERWAMGARMSPRARDSWMARTVSTGEGPGGDPVGAASPGEAPEEAASPEESAAGATEGIVASGVGRSEEEGTVPRGTGERWVMARSEGPVALVGSGEFLDVMVPVDAGLLAGRPQRAAFLPTAASLEGSERVGWWLDLGRRHYEGMGVEAVAVPVVDREDADDPELAGRIEGVGLIYLSGGDPHHLASTLRGTKVWEAIMAAWRSGAALAGCSAGAMALTSGAPPDLGPGGTRRGEPAGEGDGLGVVGGLAVIPHFDLLEKRGAGIVDWFAGWQPAGTTLVGIEEETALVGTGERWTVQGLGAVWLFGAGERERFGDGEEVPLGLPGSVVA